MKIFFKENKRFMVTVKNSVAFFVFWLLFVPGIVLAEASENIEEVIAGLQQTYEKTKDFKANFIQETTIQSIKKTDSEKGTVFFKMPRHMLWNYTRPQAKKMIINPRKTWLYLPAEKVAYTQDADKTFKSSVLIKFLSGLGKLKNDFSIKYAAPVAHDKQGNYLLVLTPLEKIAALTPFAITVDKRTFFILQISFADALGNSTVLKFTEISTNTGLSEKIFQFQPPQDVSIFNMP